MDKGLRMVEALQTIDRITFQQQFPLNGNAHHESFSFNSDPYQKAIQNQIARRDLRIAVFKAVEKGKADLTKERTSYIKNAQIVVPAHDRVAEERIMLEALYKKHGRKTEGIGGEFIIPVNVARHQRQRAEELFERDVAIAYRFKRGEVKALRSKFFATDHSPEVSMKNDPKEQPETIWLDELIADEKIRNAKLADELKLIRHPYH